MLCPRCGLDNRPDITECARCGLPYTPPPAAPYRAEPQPPSASTPAPPAQPVEPASHVPPAEPDQQATAGARPEHGDDETQTTVFPRGVDYPAPGASGPSYPAGSGYPPPQGQSSYGGYGQPSYQQSPGQQYPPQSYGGYGQQTYGGGATPGSAWPVTSSAAASGSGALGLVTTILLALGGLLGLGYAAWALTARRGIFADFADGVSVSTDDARSSDQIDTIFLIVAGLVALAALVLWVVQRAAGKTPGGGLELGGLAAAGVGVVLILVGLVLSAGVSDGGTTAEQGDKGVTSTLVLGAGFTVLAVGLLIGLVATRATSAKPRHGGR